MQYARALGARVLAIDHGSKEALCRSLGADEFVDYTQFPRDEPPSADKNQMAVRIRELTQGGCKLALMCASSSSTYVQSPYWLRFRGTIVCLGVADDPSIAVGKPNYFIYNELRMMGKFLLSLSPPCSFIVLNLK